MQVREIMSLKEARPSAKTMTSSTGMKDSHSKQHLATALRRALAKSGSGHILHGSIRRLTAAPGRRSFAWKILAFALAPEGGCAWSLSPPFGS